jgi:hypothetical protein
MMEIGSSGNRDIGKPNLTMTCGNFGIAGNAWWIGVSS